MEVPFTNNKSALHKGQVALATQRLCRLTNENQGLHPLKQQKEKNPPQSKEGRGQLEASIN